MVNTERGALGPASPLSSGERRVWQPGCSRAAGEVINGLPYLKRQSENIGGTAQASLAPPWLVFHPICLRRFSLSSVLMGPRGLSPCQLFFSPPHPPPLRAPNAPSSVWWWVAHGEGASPPKRERGKRKSINIHYLKSRGTGFF